MFNSTSNWLDGSYTLKYVKTEINDHDNIWSDGTGKLNLSGGTGTVSLSWQNQNVTDSFVYRFTDDDSVVASMGPRNYYIDFDMRHDTLEVELDQGREDITYIWTKDAAPTPPPTPTPTPPPAPTPTPPSTPIDQAYSQYFNAATYLQNKTASLNKSGLMFTEAAVSEAFKAAGFTELLHYQTYGAFELNAQGTVGINPSAGVSLNNYYVAKQAQLQSAGLNYTVQGVMEAFQIMGIDPIEHYTLLGQTEGLTLTGVAGVAEAAPVA